LNKSQVNFDGQLKDIENKLNGEISRGFVTLWLPI